jgi:hypothetical protein
LNGILADEMGLGKVIIAGIVWIGYDIYL